MLKIQEGASPKLFFASVSVIMREAFPGTMQKIHPYIIKEAILLKELSFFNMVMIADMTGSKIELAAVRQLLQEKGEALGVEIKTQHEDIFNAMHKI